MFFSFRPLTNHGPGDSISRCCSCVCGLGRKLLVGMVDCLKSQVDGLKPELASLEGGQSISRDSVIQHRDVEEAPILLMLDISADGL